MSRGRHVRRVTFVDDDATERPQQIRRKDASPPLRDVAPPRDRWLTEVFDPAGHLVAVVAATVPGGPGLVFAARHGTPAYVLLPEGLAGAFAEDGVAVLIGTPRADASVFCPLCVSPFFLDAIELHRKRGRPGRPRSVGVSPPG